LYFKTVYVNIKILLEYVYIYEYITVLYSKDRHLILAFKYNDALGFFVAISPSKIAKIIIIVFKQVSQTNRKSSLKARINPYSFYMHIKL